MPKARPRLPILLALATLACAALTTTLLGQASATAKPSDRRATASAHGHAARQRARTASGPGFMTGLGDESPEMFGDPNAAQLKMRIARYIAPWDAVAHSYSLDKAKLWIREAEERHLQVLVAFYHSEYTPTLLPSVAQYKHDVEKFIKLFPKVRQYQAWDESNRGNVRGVLASPSARATAQYYQALIRVCKGCTALGLDVLDADNISSTLAYISEFRREIGKLRTVMPRIWGLHNYSDINRLESWRTRELTRALGGQVWLTETGGIVKFGGAFPNRGGSGLRRAAKVLGYMFNVAASQPRIKRLYIYDWTGGSSSTRFDAGLTDNHHVPRPGYVVVCKSLPASRCSNVRVRNH